MSAAIASSASAPSAEIVKRQQLDPPRLITPIIDIRLTDLPLYSRVRSEAQIC